MTAGTEKRFWIPLDNAAKIFPAVRSREHTTVIRLTAVLNERIRAGTLLRAVERTQNRFPYFRVSLRRGFFWYYLEQTYDQVTVIPDTSVPCRAFGGKGENRLMVRILVRNNRLSVEMSHILTDGHGLLVFLKTLLGYYFGDEPATGIQTQNSRDLPAGEESEDAYARYFKENIPNVLRQSRAFHLPYALNRKPRFGVICAAVSVDQLRQKAREKGVSITDYLVSVYLWVLQEIYYACKKNGLPVPDKIARIQVPVNLRNIYSTGSMRNFSLYVMPEIDFRLGSYAFDEILKVVYHKMQLETDEKLISKIIARNVGSEKNYIVRGIPIWLKSLILYYKYYTEGANQYSGVVTNLGKIKLPDEISDRVDYFVLTPPPPNTRLKLNCGVAGYGDKLVLSFGNISDSTEFERKFLRFLTQQGIHVRILKN